MLPVMTSVFVTVLTLCVTPSCRLELKSSESYETALETEFSYERQFETDCSSLGPWNITLNVTHLYILRENSFLLYRKVSEAMREAVDFTFVEEAIARTGTIHVLLGATGHNADDPFITVLKRDVNSPPLWCCHVGRYTTSVSGTPETSSDMSTEPQREDVFSDSSVSRVLQDQSCCPPDAALKNQEAGEWIHTIDRQAKVLLDIIEAMNWESFVILYERQLEPQARALIALASNKYHRLLIARVEDQREVRDIMLTYFETSPEFHIVLVTSMAKSQQILHMAADLEPQIGKRISVTGLSRWLLFNLDGVVTPDDFMFSTYFDNIAVLSEPQLLGAGHTVTTHPDEMFVLTTLLYKTGRRELSVVGSVHYDWTLNLQQDVHPNVKFGFNGRPFIVTTTPWAPYVYREEAADGTVSFSGFCMDMADELSRTLNFTIQYVEPPDGYWGNEDGNGTWNGMVGQVIRQEVDMIVAPMGITEAREAVIDFTSPFFYDDSAVILKKPDPNKSKWRTYIDIFREEVLICIAGALLGGFIIISVLVRTEMFIFGRKRKVFANSYFGSLLYLLGALLAQGGRNLPKSASARIFLSSWWLFCIVVAGTYSGNLIAVLTVTKDKPPFSTLKEMANQDEYKFGTLGNSMWSELFRTSPRPEFQAIHKKMEDYYHTDEDIYHSSPDFHLEKVKRGGYAYIADKGLFSTWLANNCDLILLKEKFFPGKYGIGLPNHSVYTKVFSDQIVKIYESGLLQVWIKRWWPQQTFCSGSLITQARTLSLIDVQSSFYVLAIGVALSTLFLMVEFVYSIFVNLRRSCKEYEEKAGDSKQKVCYNGEEVTEGNSWLSEGTLVVSSIRRRWC